MFKHVAVIATRISLKKTQKSKAIWFNTHLYTENISHWFTNLFFLSKALEANENSEFKLSTVQILGLVREKRLIRCYEMGHDITTGTRRLIRGTLAQNEHVSENKQKLENILPIYFYLWWDWDIWRCLFFLSSNSPWVGFYTIVK